jgi:surface antigen
VAENNVAAGLEYNFGGAIMSAGGVSVPWMKRLVIVVLAALLAACQSADTRRVGGLAGSIAGAIGGSYLGRYLGGGTAGAIVTSIAGGVAGYYVGAGIGGYLGRDDQKKMASASQQAFYTGEPQTFSNPDSGVKGRAEIIRPSDVAQQSSGNCKTIRQTVVLKDGTTHTEDVKSCK